MCKMQVNIIAIYILIIVQQGVIHSQIMPISPCPNYFQYRFDGQHWFGRLRIENPLSNDPLHLKVTLSVRGNPLTNYLGEIELLTRGRPADEYSMVFYNVKFPLTSIPPRLIKISANNRTICFGTQDFGGLVTLIHLEHTREFSYLSKGEISQLDDSSNYQEATRKDLENISRENHSVLKKLYETCGKMSRNLERNNKYKNGELIRGSWPWLAAIYVNNYTSLTYICGGTIISKNIVLTAAHCFHIYQKKYNANEVLVFLGRHNLQNWNEDGSSISTIDNIFIHPDYDNNLSSYDADIAVVILKNSIKFGQYIRPACLWNDSEEFEYTENARGTLIGWGYNDFNILSSLPKKLENYIVTNSKCIKDNKRYRNLISSRTFCAGGDLPCAGHSGGGLMLYKNERWRLKGIVSGSLPGSCKSNKFVIYTDVSKFLDWIYAFII
ncbi:serine protease gd [Condylostylus longicornis]|uniref:serine protease gd n=1 Tax=Condylostylus longicornis TaxID=2530218 RepID=UPI00244E2561|nr:serine protease gd [Condylostylus longicornis]